MNTKKRLGKSDLFVNPIGLGANAVGGHNIYKNLQDEIGKEVVKIAIQNGIDFIDTAYRYGNGRSEELIGEVVKELSVRQNVVIATKGAHRTVGNETIIDNSPSFLKEEVEKSLKRLQTDYIDLYYIHFPDKTTPKYEAVGALKELKDQGKIRAIGVSNFSIEQLKEANQDGYIDVVQGHYNLLSRDAEKELLPFTIENEISFIPYFPLASGLLTGKYNKNTVIDEQKARQSHFQGENYVRNIAKVEKLVPLAQKKNTSVANVVLAWYLTQEGIHAVIPGAKRPEQVLSNIDSMKVQLTQDEIDFIDRVFR